MLQDSQWPTRPRILRSRGQRSRSIGLTKSFALCDAVMFKTVDNATINYYVLSCFCVAVTSSYNVRFHAWAERKVNRTAYAFSLKPYSETHWIKNF